MKKIILNAFTLLAFCTFVQEFCAQSVSDKLKTPLPSPTNHTRFFVAPTSDGFSNFLSAALFENRLAIQVTADETMADYIVVGSNSKGQNKWYDTVFGVEKDRNQGSMKVIRVVDKVIVWASASGDKSFWFAEFKNMGQAKVANRLARKLKSDLPRILLSAGTDSSTDYDRRGQALEILRKESSMGGGVPTDAAGLNQIGMSQFQQGNYVGAEVSFREATRKDSPNAVYHYNLGTALNALGMLAEAENEIELAIQLAPSVELYKKSLEIIRNNRRTRLPS